MKRPFFAITAIGLIVQRQERSIDEAAILEVWHNWSDWSAYLKGMVD